MKKRSLLAVKLTLVISLLASLLAGCGLSNVAQENYPLEVVNQDGAATSYVYRAAGESVPQVAELLAEQRSPKQISESSEERMFLVYSDEIIHLQQDPQKPEDTLIEVDSKEYVQRNYDSSFLQGYLTAQLIGSLFDSMNGGGGYRGYTSRDVYQPKQGSYREATSADKKVAPPMTVQKKGSITRRGTTDSTKNSVGNGGSIFNRNPGTGTDTNTGKSGSITRNKKQDNGGIFSSPRKSITKPKTRVGSGKIVRRR